MLYDYEINGIAVRTGDLICTVDGGGESILGQFWRAIGKLLPGAVDHIAVYVGPAGRCVEAGAKGRVVAFHVKDGNWDAESMTEERGLLIDTLYGVAYPLEGRNLSSEEMDKIRREVADYCLRQAEAGKPYNLNYLDSSTEERFYCSQLAYKAYLRMGLDLNTGVDIPDIPGTDRIIYPQEIWAGCPHKRA